MSPALGAMFVLIPLGFAAAFCVCAQLILAGATRLLARYIAARGRALVLFRRLGFRSCVRRSLASGRETAS